MLNDGSSVTIVKLEFVCAFMFVIKRRNSRAAADGTTHSRCGRTVIDDNDDNEGDYAEHNTRVRGH